MQFSSDEAMDYPTRQWWWFPDQGWVTPYGMQASDHLIRAKVRYGTGVCEELGPKPVGGMLPTVLSRGRLCLQPSADRSQLYAGLHDPSGRLVMPLHPGDNDVSLISPGVYFSRTSTTSRRVIIAR